MLTHGELFAGIGGFGLGFDNAGMKTIWHVEIDKNCQNVLRNHYTDSLILSDVREVGKHNLPYVDVISFGSPCQDLSVAGKRKGLIDGKRSNLFFEAIRIVDELKPAFAVWENVPGSLSSNSGRDFAIVLNSFRECGACDIAWRILDAQYFGVPQRRRRIFVVADFRGGRAAEVLFESEGVSGNIETKRKAGQDVAYSIRANPSHSGDKGDGGINTTMIASTLSTSLGHHGWGIEDQDITNLQVSSTVETGINKRMRPEQVIPIVFDMAQITSKEHGTRPSEISQPLNTLGQMSVFDARGNGNGEIVPNLTGDHGNRVTDYTPVIAWKESAGNGQGGKGFHGKEDQAFSVGGYVQRVGVRRLTPTECERLQGFPDGWTAGQSDSARYRQLGNAVAVPVVEWIGKRIIQAMMKGEHE